MWNLLTCKRTHGLRWILPVLRLPHRACTFTVVESSQAQSATAHCYLCVYCSPAPLTAGGFLIDIRITADTKLSSSRGRRGGGGRGNIILSRKTGVRVIQPPHIWNPTSLSLCQVNRKERQCSSSVAPPHGFRWQWFTQWIPYFQLFTECLIKTQQQPWTAGIPNTILVLVLSEIILKALMIHTPCDVQLGFGWGRVRMGKVIIMMFKLVAHLQTQTLFICFHCFQY